MISDNSAFSGFLRASTRSALSRRAAAQRRFSGCVTPWPASERFRSTRNGLLIDAASTNLAKPGEAYVPVYYPGTADPQSASRIDVRPGADVRGIDFILAGVTTRKVRGTVFNGVTGQPADIANVQLVPRTNIGKHVQRISESGEV